VKFKLEDIKSDKYLGQIFVRQYGDHVLVVGHFESGFNVWNIKVITPEGGTLGFTTNYRGRGMMLSKDTLMKPADYSKILEDDKRGFILNLFKLDAQDRL